MALLAISLIVFLMLRVLPGDIAAVMAGTNSPPERVAQLRAQMGLDKPLPQQYFEWVGGLLRGDFGTTMLTGQPVASVVASRAAITFPLIVLGMLVALLFGIPLGYLAVRTTNRAAKALFQTIAIIEAPFRPYGAVCCSFCCSRADWACSKCSRRRDSRVVGGPIRPAHRSVWCCRHSPWA